MIAAANELTCPRCRLPLKQVRTSHGIFWACGNCGGRAITVELLRETFTPESINPLWLHALRKEGQSGAPCPSCKNPMIEVASSDRANMNVDVCQRCHFVWFDTREVDTLIPRPLPPAQAELPQKARELLAIEKVKRLAEEARGSDFGSVPPDEFWKQIAACFWHARRIRRGATRSTTVGNLDPVCCNHRRQWIRIYTPPRNRCAIWIDSRAGDAAARSHFPNFILSSRRPDSSHREHVFPFCFRRRR